MIIRYIYSVAKPRCTNSRDLYSHSGECSRIGLSLALSCDVRIAVEGTTFDIFGNEKISEYEIRLLQHILKHSRNPSWIHRIIITAGKFGTKDALENGIVSNAYRNSADAMNNSLGLAKTMSMRDAESTVSTKLAIARARDPRSGEYSLPL